MRIIANKQLLDKEIQNTTARHHTRTALMVAAGVAAAVAVAGVAAVAAPHHGSLGRGTNASGDLDMQALAQLAGDPSGAPDPSGSPGGPGRHGPGGMPAWFRRMDRNGDGDVSPREWLGTEEDFKRLDADGDVLISPEEARKAEVKK